MQWMVIGSLVLVVIIFGISSTSQSYATAQQAKAQIETAQVAQINAWGNLVTIVTIAFLAVLFVALVALLVWMLYKRSTLTRSRITRVDQPAVEAKPELQLSVSDLVQLEALRMLKEMRGGSTPALPERPSDDDVPLWLQ
jgi:O-antigen/teichoic acid export membrane protein